MWMDNTGHLVMRHLQRKFGVVAVRCVFKSWRMLSSFEDYPLNPVCLPDMGKEMKNFTNLYDTGDV